MAIWGTAVYTITPTLVNEVTVSESWDTYSFYTLDNMASEKRSLVPGLPSLFPVPTAADNGSVLPINFMEITEKKHFPGFRFSGGWKLSLGRGKRWLQEEETAFRSVKAK